MEQRLARDRRLAMELLVEQTYRFPDKPPKNVAGLIDRASLLAFYRVHNAGLATEAKVEEILSGYRGRTHVLALMLAKKYGKKLVERLQSTPRSPASTARRVLRPVNSSARQQRTKKKVRAAVVAEERVPFATLPDEERAAVASARRVIVVADASKLGEESLVRFGGLDDIDALVTDGEPDADLSEALRVADVDLVRA